MQILSPEAAADVHPVAYERRLISDLPVNKIAKEDLQSRGIYTMVDLDMWLVAGNNLQSIKQIGPAKEELIYGIRTAWQESAHWAEVRAKLNK